MAEMMKKTNYLNMIQALHKFASDTSKTCEERRTAATTCSTALGSEDQAISKITSGISGIAANYQALAVEALRIANLMQEELITIDDEGKGWDEE